MTQTAFGTGRVHTRIHTARGTLVAAYLEIAGTDILVLTQPTDMHRDGTVFVPNRQLAKDSGNRLTHMAYPLGLYEAFRGGRHTVRHGGALPEPANGEIRELETDVAVARAYVGTLLCSGLLMADEERTLRLEQQRLLHNQSAKRNDHKKIARDQFERGLKLTDALGRRNPMAAAWVTGAAIGHLLTRQGDVRRISASVDRRTIHLYGAIESSLSPFRDLRRELTPRRGKQRPGMLELLLEPKRGPGALKRAAKMLRAFANALVQLRAQPFLEHARRLTARLRSGAIFAEVENREQLERVYRDVREDLVRVFARHTLELEIIAPLSFLLEDLRTAEWAARRQRGSKSRQRAPIRNDMAPERFRRIRDSLEEFRTNLSRCPGNLPIAASAIDTARAHIAADNWPAAKKALKAASGLL